MRQSEMFDRAHGLDPESSHMAVARHIESGNCHTNAEIILEVIKKNQPMTAAELAYIDDRLCKMGIVEVRRRLSDLKNLGRVKRLPCVKCKVATTMACQWSAT